MPFLKEKLSSYPTSAGVYIMKDASGKILYIGKAKNLKKRLRQYFLIKTDERATIPLLLAQIKDIETIVVENEKEALLLENNLIKKNKPKYNLLLKDDKTFASLVITSHKWPQIKLMRIKKYKKSENEYFGPYTNAKAARQVLDLILKLFPLRQCSNSELTNRIRACILYDIKRCIAPCIGKCSQKEYQNHLQGARSLLKGENKTLLKELKKEIQRLSKNLEYEKAADTLQLIKQIKHISEIQHVENLSFTSSDAIGYFVQDNEIILTVLSYREGRLIASEHFSFSFFLKNLNELVEAFLLQYYQKDKQQHKNKDFPKTILLPLTLKAKGKNQEGSSCKKALEEILTGQSTQLKNTKGKQQNKNRIKLLFPRRGEKLSLVKAAMKNAQSLFEREQKLYSLHEKWLLNLQEILKLNHYPRSILTFDASHISEQARVATLVSFVNGVKNTQKLFKIKTSQMGDLSALEEVLTRYFSKANELPDLMLIDGGKVHLSTALKVLKSLNIATIDVIGLSKEQARHDKGLRKEAVWLPYQKKPLFINPSSPALFLLQKMRDETHRVAITFHRKIRSQNIQKSLLDEIPGIGKEKKKALLIHFKSLERIKKATKEKLKEVKLLNQKDIERIYKFFHEKH